MIVKRILTGNGREYRGRGTMHPYQIFIELNEIMHRRTKVAAPRAFVRLVMPPSLASLAA